MPLVPKDNPYRISAFWSIRFPPASFHQGRRERVKLRRKSHSARRVLLLKRPEDLESASR
jgi:hypothetical protein